MLPAVNRLADGAVFRETVRTGRRAGSTTLVVHLATHDDAPPAPVRVGFVVSRAVGNAVVRNRVKRRLRHLTREHLANLQELPGRVVLVVRALPAAGTASSAALGADLAHCLRKAAA